MSDDVGFRRREACVALIRYYLVSRRTIRYGRALALFLVRGRFVEVILAIRANASLSACFLSNRGALIGAIKLWHQTSPERRFLHAIVSAPAKFVQAPRWRSAFLGLTALDKVARGSEANGVIIYIYI